MTKAIIIDSTLGQYTAEDISWLQKFFLQPGVLADSSGVLGLAVSQRGAGANLSVDVAVGNALIDFTKNSTNWKIIGLSNTITNVVVPTQSSGSNRVGALIMRASIVNEPNVLKNNIITLEFIPGTSTSPLSDGAITSAISNDMFLRLADITVPTGASSIVTGNIADTRVQCKTNEAITLAPKNLKFTVQTTDPVSPVEGQVWYNSTNHTLNFYNNSSTIQLGSASGLFNPLVASAQSTPDMTLAVTTGDVRFNGINTRYAGGNSPTFIKASLSYDIELALNPTNGESVTIVVNGTSIVVNFVSSIGAAAGNLLIQGTVAATRAALANFLNNPGITNANQVAFSAPNQTLLGYLKATDDLSLKCFVEGISGSLTSLSMSETMAGAGNVVTANTTKHRIDLLTLNSAGSLAIVRGAYSVSPVAPNYPAGSFVIAEVYIKNGGTVIKSASDGTNSYINRDVRGFSVVTNSFSGDGSDGALIVNVGTVNIDLGGLAVVTKNYTSIEVTGSGQVTFSNPHAGGTIIRLKSQGDVILTSSTIPNIDASGMGAIGGTGSVQAVSTPTAGGSGTTGNGILDTLANHGGNSPTAGAIITANVLYNINSIDGLYRNFISLFCGSGGGGGSGGADGNSQGVSGGNGGRGGGALQINCGGYLNFTSTLGISVAGKVGQNGTAKNSSNGASGTGAGGGGAGGTCYVFYNKLTSASGTINTAGGAGGVGGDATDTAGGGGGVAQQGGNGGGGASSLAGVGGAGGAQAVNSSNAGSAAGAARAGGGGGSGASCDYNTTTTRSGGTGGAGGASENALVAQNFYF